jgi:hypothetical protein
VELNSILAQKLAEKIEALKNERDRTKQEGIDSTASSNSTNPDSDRSINSGGNTGSSAGTVTGTNGFAEGTNEPATTVDRTRNGEREPGNGNISPVSVTRVEHPGGRKIESGNDSRGEDGRENRTVGNGTEKEPTNIPIDDSVSSEQEPKLRRGRKTKEIERVNIPEEAVTYGIESLFALTASVRGPHWYRSTEQCKTVSIPLTNMLAKLPADQSKRIIDMVDPLAVVIGAYFLVLPGLQGEQELKNKNVQNTFSINEPSNRKQDATNFNGTGIPADLFIA